MDSPLKFCLSEGGGRGGVKVLRVAYITFLYVYQVKVL